MEIKSEPKEFVYSVKALRLILKKIKEEHEEHQSKQENGK